ncbi:MAG: hypothetical protein P1V20_21300 [Verrucomicrobiales bacterium]|nr:hypothetical protein [Verrucomicrobiales bacterium]
MNQKKLILAILSSMPLFAFSQTLEGWTEFKSKDHPKSKLSNFSISYPNTWTRSESKRPNIIQSFKSNNGKGPTISSIIIKQLDIPESTRFSKEELRELFTPDFLKSQAPKGSKVTTTKQITLESLPSGLLRFETEEERIDQSLFMTVTSFVTINGNDMIQLMFSTGGPLKFKDKIKAVHTYSEKEIMAIANSYVWIGKFER